VPIVITRFMLSVFLCPKVITLNGFQCNWNKLQIILQQGSRNICRQSLDVSEVSPEVFDELDAAFLLLPELEVAVAARGHDEPGLRRDAMRHIIAVPNK